MSTAAQVAQLLKALPKGAALLREFDALADAEVEAAA